MFHNHIYNNICNIYNKIIIYYNISIYKCNNMCDSLQKQSEDTKTMKKSSYYETPCIY